MTYVVTSGCIGCKHTDCVIVCPTDSFHEGSNFLVINPDDCIDCGICVGECPVNAIYSDADVPASETQAIALNAELSQRWPNIIERKPALPDAARWKDVPDKYALLDMR
ncbi:MAG: ferredoxin FdxA [Gammaproteobacteria bacterium]